MVGLFLNVISLFVIDRVFVIIMRFFGWFKCLIIVVVVLLLLMIIFWLLLIRLVVNLLMVVLIGEYVFCWLFVEVFEVVG